MGRLQNFGGDFAQRHLATHQFQDESIDTPVLAGIPTKVLARLCMSGARNSASTVRLDASGRGGSSVGRPRPDVAVADQVCPQPHPNGITTASSRNGLGPGKKRLRVHARLARKLARWRSRSLAASRSRTNWRCRARFGALQPPTHLVDVGLGHRSVIESCPHRCGAEMRFRGGEAVAAPTDWLRAIGLR